MITFRKRLLGATLLAALVVLGGCIAAIGNRGIGPETLVDLAGDYRIDTIWLDDGSWALLRYRADTGEAWYTRAGRNDVWVPIVDEEYVEDSHFVFEPRTTGGNGWTVVRLDTRTGRTWIIRDSVWVEVADPPAV